jgi:hypothetical protein
MVTQKQNSVKRKVRDVKNTSSPLKKTNKHMDRALKLFSQITEINHCTAKHCKKQQQEYDIKNKENKKKLYSILMQNAKKPSKKLAKEALKIKIDMLKSDEKRKVVDCQLEKCNKQTKNVLQTTFEVLTDPKTPVPIKLREIGKKYKEIFKKVITTQQVIQADIDTLKIKK